MTTGEKLTRLRRERGWTQEQLASILDVSRQSVSKWESDLSYPETEKLIRLANLYNCSMDYLLRDVPEGEAPAPEQASRREDSGKRVSLSIDFNSISFERKSKRTIRGLPLWHVNLGFGCRARGVFALGFVAEGVVSVGLLSLGVVSLGLLSLGLLAWGVLALGLVAGGSFALGVIAMGAVCVGVVSIGAVATGLFAAGAKATGVYFAIGDHASALIAVGKTIAQGTLYRKLGFDLSPGEVSEIKTLLAANTPAILGWARWLIGLFL